MMRERLNRLLDSSSNFFAHRKGLIPLIGIILVVLNYIFQFIPGLGWVAHSNLMLHLGVVIAIFGFLLAWAL